MIRGSGEPSVTSVTTEDDGTLGFKIDPGNLYVNDVNNRFTIYQWRDQSAGGYTNPNYQLKEVTTTPPTVQLVFDHPPRFPDPVTGSCSPPAAPDKNYPYLQAQGDDVISGANFTTNGVCTPSAASKNAKIYTVLVIGKIFF